MSKKFVALIAGAVLLFSLVILLKWSGWGTSALWSLSNEGTWLLPLVLVAALIDSINPCAFGILLLTITFLFSIGQMRRGVLKIGGAYILGLMAVYLLIGLGLLQALHLFDTPHFMAKVGAGIVLVLGAINLVNHFFPSFPIKLKIPTVAHERLATLMNKASAPAAFLLGAVVGLCEFPCTGGPYLMVIGLLNDSQTYLAGVGYLIFYNLLFILPLVIILLIASHEALLAKVQAWKRAETKNLRFWSGLAMIILGIFILFL